MMMIGVVIDWWRQWSVINDDGDGGGDGDGDNHKGDESDCADVSGRVGDNLSDYYS